jgi:hypothetical protein
MNTPDQEQLDARELQNYLSDLRAVPTPKVRTEWGCCEQRRLALAVCWLGVRRRLSLQEMIDDEGVEGT